MTHVSLYALPARPLETRPIAAALDATASTLGGFKVVRLERGKNAAGPTIRAVLTIDRAIVIAYGASRGVAAPADDAELVAELSFFTAESGQVRLAVDWRKNATVASALGAFVEFVVSRLGAEELDAEAADEGVLGMLRERAEKIWGVDETFTDGFSLTVIREDRSRSQLVSVHRVDGSDGRAWIWLQSFVAPLEKLDPEAALRRSFTLDFASLCVDGEHYLLVYTHAADSLTANEFEHIVQHFAALADDLEDELTGGDDAF